MTCRSNTSFAPEEPKFYTLLMDLLRDAHEHKYAFDHAKKDVEILSLLPNESLKADHRIQDGKIFSTYQKVTKDTCSVDLDRESAKDMISAGAPQSETSDEQPLSRRSEPSRTEVLEASRKVYKNSRKNVHNSTAPTWLTHRRSQRVANMSRELNFGVNANFGRQDNADDSDDESEDDSDAESEDDNDNESDNANDDESDNANDDAIDDNSHDDESEIVFIETRSDKQITKQVIFFDPKEVEERMHRIEWCRKAKVPPCHPFQREQAVNCHDMADSAEKLQDGRLDWGKRRLDESCTRKRGKATERIQDLNSMVQQPKQSKTTPLETTARATRKSDIYESPENNEVRVNAADTHEKKSSHCSTSRAKSERSTHFENSKGIKKVYCGNLSPRVNATTLRRFFGACGNIVSIHFPRKPGLAFVEFSSVSGALKAIKRDGERAKEEIIKVEICQMRDEIISIGIPKKTNAGRANDEQNNKTRLLNNQHAMSGQKLSRKMRKLMKKLNDTARIPQMESLGKDNGTVGHDDYNSTQTVLKEPKSRGRNKSHKTKKYRVRLSEETNAGRVYDGTDKREQNNRKRQADSQHVMSRQTHKKKKKIKKKESKMAQDTNFDKEYGESGHGDYNSTKKVFKEHRKEPKGRRRNKIHKTKKSAVGISEETNADRAHDGTDKREQNNRKRQTDSQHTQSDQVQKKKKIKKEETEMAQITKFGRDYHNAGGNFTHKDFKEHRKEKQKGRGRNQIQKMKKSTVGITQESHVVQRYPRETNVDQRYTVVNHCNTKRFQGEWDANRQAYRFSKRVHIKW